MRSSRASKWLARRQLLLGRVGHHLCDRSRVLVVDMPGYVGADGVPDEEVGRVALMGAAAAHFESYAARASADESGVVRLMIDYWFGEGAFARMPDPVRVYLDAAAQRNALDVRSSFNDTETAAELGSFTSLVHVAYGDGSPEIVRAIGRALRQLMPNARMEALAGANHGMLDSLPEAVARLIAGRGSCCASPPSSWATSSPRSW